MTTELNIINYPDPRLRKMSVPVTVFDQPLKDLVGRMIELMKSHRGVGLAAPQVGLNIRVFIINPTGESEDLRIYINPKLSDGEGEEEAEEGCLSLPNINARIWRMKKLTMTAQDLDGNPFTETEEGFVARIWQHENDHLDGKMIIDRMGPVAKLASRRLLKELQEKWDARK